MTDKEKEILKAEIIDEITQKMKPALIREDTQRILKKPRNRWFRDKDAPMFEVFGCYVYWQVWECVRRITCYICGKGYVRQLTDSDHADQVAEQLCELIYKLAVERRNQDAEQSFHHGSFDP